MDETRFRGTPLDEGALDTLAEIEEAEMWREHTTERIQQMAQESLSYAETRMALQSAYDLDDPKHPTFHERMSDVWDNREGK